MDPSDVEGTCIGPTNPGYTFDQITSDSSNSHSSAFQDSDETQDSDEIQPNEVLKKNLVDEEEFRPVDQKEPIQIFLKMRPLTDVESRAQADQHLYDFHGETGVSVRPPATSCYAQKKQTLQTLTGTVFQFSYVFQQEISQAQFFASTIQPCLEKFFAGANLLIFNYGLTNSGKTYTMQGSNTQPGLIPRTLDCLFETIRAGGASDQDGEIFRYKPHKFNEIVELTDTIAELDYKAKLLDLSAADASGLERSESGSDMNQALAGIGFMPSSKIALPGIKQYAVWISYFELFENKVYDLLTLKSSKSIMNKRSSLNRSQLKVRDDANKVPYVEGLTYVSINNTQEAIRILKYGEKNMQKASESINLSSSRSHGIICLKIIAHEKLDKKKTATVTQLSFCDLAGQKRSQTYTTGKTAKEAAGTNTSLLSLSRLLNAMIANEKAGANEEQVPYRDNKLTRLFQAYFEGRGMVKMVVNFNPSSHCFDESVGVLKFAATANQIQIGVEKEASDKFSYEIEAKKANSSETKDEDEEDEDEDSREEDEEVAESETDKDEESKDKSIIEGEITTEQLLAELKQLKEENAAMRKCLAQEEKARACGVGSEQALMNSTVITIASPVKVDLHGLGMPFMRQSCSIHSLKLDNDETEKEEKVEKEEKMTECAGENVSKAGLEMKKVACQLVGAAVESVESCCDLVGEEMGELMVDKLQLKSDECELIKVKFLAKVDLVVKLTSEARHMENEQARIVAELTSDKAKLSADLSEAQTKQHNASTLSNERYEQLEKTHHQALLDLEKKQALLDQLSIKLTECKLDREEVEGSVKEAEIKDLMTDVSENSVDDGSLEANKTQKKGDKKFTCDKCFKTFSRNSSLKEHYRLHTGEKPHKCTKCDKNFTQKSGLSYHLKTKCLAD